MSWHKLKQGIWNLFARYVLRYATCEVCDDTRGDTIGNGQIIDGVLMCDNCHSNHRHYPYFWRHQP